MGKKRNPNLIDFEIECWGDKTGGARDMIEVKVN